MKVEPGLAPRLREQVELVLVVSGRDGRHRADRPVLGVDRDHGGGRVVAVVQRLLDRLPGGALEARIDRRVDLEAAAAHGRGAVLRDQLVADVAEEVRLADRGVELARLQAEWPLHGPVVLVALDVALVEHRQQDVVPARSGDLGAVERVVGARELRQPGEQRRLGKVQLGGVLRVVRLRGRLDPVGEVAVVHLVHVRGEDAVLRPGVVQLDREARLLQLPLDRALAADVEVADELLRDRRAALDDLAGVHVLPERPRDALDVDAAVLVEAPVLDRDGRLRHPGADPRERHRLTVPLGRDRAEDRVVRRVDEGVLADRDRPQGVQIAVGAEGRDAGDGRAGNDEEEPEDRDDGEHDRAAAMLLPHASAFASCGGGRRSRRRARVLRAEGSCVGPELAQPRCAHAAGGRVRAARRRARSRSTPAASGSATRRAS